jgi:NAD(P)-dependent dehydrogenase (short-subunit alcohol dehydrogenase family)
MSAKTVLITGATSGIGKQTAITLAKLGFRVIITGRNKTSGLEAVSEIKQLSENDNVELLLADISTQWGVKTLAAEVIAKVDALDVLINNAGSATNERKLNSEGVELNFAINVIAPYLLTTLLMDTLKKSPSPRVVSLMGGDLPITIDLDNLQAENSFDGLNSYSQSKMAMMAVMREYAERTKESGITMNICYPGQASTSMTQGVTADMLPGAMKVIFPIFKFFVRPDGGKSAAKASRSSIFLATSNEVEGETGLYYSKNVKRSAFPLMIENPAVRAVVWDYMQKLLI